MRGKEGELAFAVKTQAIMTYFINNGF